MSGGQSWFECILKRPQETGWPISTNLPIDRVVDAVIDPDRIIGIRTPKTTAMVICDVDAHHGGASKYWRGDGQSQQLIELEHNSGAAGCSTVITRSSNSGGIHAITFTPEPVKRHLQHHVGAELTSQSGMDQRPGQLEIYPSEQRWQSGWQQQAASVQQGVRLPGQIGSAVLIGDRWESDPIRIYEVLVAELEATLSNQSPIDWGQLLDLAQRRVDAQFKQQRNKVYGKQRTVPAWTGSGQSNVIVRDMVWNALVEHNGATEQAIVTIAVDRLQSHPGYRQHASYDTQKRIDSGAWPTEWLRAHAKRDGAVVREQSPRDSERNDRLRGETLAKLQAAVAEHGEHLLELSERAAAALINITRDTWRKVRGMVSSMLVDTPPIKGPAKFVPADSADRPVAVPAVEPFKTAVLVPPTGSAVAPTSGVQTETKENSLQRRILVENLAEIRSIVSNLRPVGRSLPAPADPVSPINWGECPAVGNVSPFCPAAVPSTSRREQERAEMLAYLNGAAA